MIIISVKGIKYDYFKKMFTRYLALLIVIGYLRWINILWMIIKYKCLKR
jgi:hypothetical protein